jgi:glutamate carboxypeptidase
VHFSNELIIEQGMHTLSTSEHDCLARIDPAPMLDQVLAWSAINTGTRNLDGLARQADVLAEAFAALPGDVELEEAAPVRRSQPTDGPLPLPMAAISSCGCVRKPTGAIC